MIEMSSRRCTAFAGMRRIAQGALMDVALAVHRAERTGAPILTFDDASGDVIDLDLRGSTAEIVARLAMPDTPARGRGRPKLGVVAREVTLLPRHWDWLAEQPGGASQALRRLIDEARRSGEDDTRRRAARDAAYRFLSALAGDLPGFEEASRALFADDAAGFADRMADWPADVRDHALWLIAQAGGAGSHEADAFRPPSV